MLVRFVEMEDKRMQVGKIMYIQGKDMPRHLEQTIHSGVVSCREDRELRTGKDPSCNARSVSMEYSPVVNKPAQRDQTWDDMMAKACKHLEAERDK